MINLSTEPEHTRPASVADCLQTSGVGCDTRSNLNVFRSNVNKTACDVSRAEANVDTVRHPAWYDRDP